MTRHPMTCNVQGESTSIDRRTALRMLGAVGAAAPLTSLATDGANSDKPRATAEPLTRILGVQYPILQAPMGRSATVKLAAAVSNAGALGMISVGWDELDVVREKVERMRAATSRPFCVNLCLDGEDQRARLELLREMNVRLISLFWGDPSPYVRQIKDGGAVLLQTVSSVEEARRAAGAGCDVIVAQSSEAGGHCRTSVPMLAFLPQVCDAVEGTPVIAAGGISDARGIRAVRALGAQGVWIGTRFLATRESGAHPYYKQRILAAGSEDTESTLLFDVGWPNALHRVLRNSTYERWVAAGSPPSGKRPGEGDIVGHMPDGTPIRRYATLAPTEVDTGDVEAFPLYSGQGVGLVRDLPSVAELIERLAPGLAS